MVKKGKIEINKTAKAVKPIAKAIQKSIAPLKDSDIYRPNTKSAVSTKGNYPSADVSPEDVARIKMLSERNGLSADTITCIIFPNTLQDTPFGPKTTKCFSAYLRKVEKILKGDK